jgi:hypothetical protein
MFIPTAVIEPRLEVSLSIAQSSPQWTMAFGMTNQTGQDIAVITRNGLRFIIPRSRAKGYDVFDKALYFSEGFEVCREGDVELSKVDKVPEKGAEPSGINLMKAYDHGQRKTDWRAMRGARQYHRLTLDALQEAGGTVYIHELDIVVTQYINVTSIYHPFSRDGLLDTMCRQNEDSVGAMFQCFIVDNHRYLSDRYINLLGRVHRVQKLYKPGHPEGFYARHPKSTSVGDGAIEYDIIHLPVEVAEKEYQLFKTPEDAQTLGFSKEALENENLRLKRQTMLTQHEATEREFERSETTAERKDRLQKEKDTRELRDHELAIAKAKWEGMGSNIKQSVIIVGVIIGAITTVLGLAGKLAEAKAVAIKK